MRGGKEFHRIPCVNASQAWIAALGEIVAQNLQGWPVQAGTVTAIAQSGVERDFDELQDFQLNRARETSRIDKWLWAARFFSRRVRSRRTLSRKAACASAEANVKPAKDVRVGDCVEIEIERFVWQVQVLGVCDVRGPATVAQTLYAETDEGREKAGRAGKRRKTYREPAERTAIAARPARPPHYRQIFRWD